MKPFARDPRIILLEDVSEISLCRGFNGAILCPYEPLTGLQETRVLSFAKRKICDRETYDVDDSIDPQYPETWKEIIGRYPPGLDILKDGLRNFYNAVSGGVATTVSLRVNSTYPSWKHAHKEWAAVYTLSGAGTIGFDENGQPYELPRRHVFAIPPDFEHAAPARTAPRELRVTIALSRPEI